MYTLITNANPILSALIFGRAREILFSPLFEFITTEFTTWEVKKYIPSFARKLQQRLERAGTIVSIAKIERRLFSELDDLPIETVYPRFYEDKLADAGRLIGHRDPKDVDLLALALKTGNPIWSDDKDFEGIAQITLLKTKHLLQLLD
jgi:predicted nucleic acid-binding protein